MPSRIEQTSEVDVHARQLAASTRDGEFMDGLVQALGTSDAAQLWQSLDSLCNARELDIERICTRNHQEFVDSVHRLDEGRENCSSLGNEILSLVQSYQESTDNLAAQKKNLVDSRSVRQNIDESADVVKGCLIVLRLSNQVQDLVARQNHYAALRALDELQTMLDDRDAERYKIDEMVELSIPATQNMIAEAVMTDLNTWLYRIRDVSQYIGEVAFFHTEQRRARQEERGGKNPFLGRFRLNSAVELVADEMEDFDLLNNDEADIHVDFTPLFECLHIHDALGQSERFRSDYGTTRRRQKDLLVPSTIPLQDEELAEMHSLLEGIAGFAIIERATMKRTENLRTPTEVDDLWDSMSQSAIALLTNATHALDHAGTLLSVTNAISVFIQTMEGWDYPTTAMNAFLLSLFEKYNALLHRQCSDEFQLIVNADSYRPMTVNDLEQYDDIIEAGFYVSSINRDEITFPCIVPFSQMYPACCTEIREFIQQVYAAPNEYLQRSDVVDRTVQDSIENLLSERICQPLVDRLSSGNPGQIVQILANCEYFEKACHGFEDQLMAQRMPASTAGPIKLAAADKFIAARRAAEERIFELIRSKIDDLTETAEYDWSSTTAVNEPSNYITELTRYLTNIIGSVLLGLPLEIKDFIYSDALNHAATNILALPLDPTVSSISPAALHSFSLDVLHLTTVVQSLAPAITLPSRQSAAPSSSALDKTVDRLSQTIALMKTADPNSFYDIAQRNKLYARVDPQDGAMLLEKVDRGRDDAMQREAKELASAIAAETPATGPGTVAATPAEGAGKSTKVSDRFGSVVRGLRRAGESDNK